MSLIEFCGHGLNHMFVPEKYRFAFTFFGEQGSVDSNPRLGCKYTLNTLLGLVRSNCANGVFRHNPAGIYERTCDELKNHGPQPADVAMAIWSGIDGGFRVPDWVFQWFDVALPDFRGWNAQDLAWSLLAICSAHNKNETRWDGMAGKISAHLIDDCQHPKSGFFYFEKSPVRHSFSSFAVPVYVNLALAEYAKVFNDEHASKAATKGIIAMLALQHPQHAGWAWFHDVQTGAVVDWYRFYSVHQDSMGPMTLLRGMELGVPGARAALVNGFQWILGDNELGVPTIDRQWKIIHRSIGRKCTAAERPYRLMKAYWHRFTGTPASLLKPSCLEVNTECRSYELGWILWTFAGRNDFPELTELKQFEIDTTGPHH